MLLLVVAAARVACAPVAVAGGTVADAQESTSAGFSPDDESGSSASGSRTRRFSRRQLLTGFAGGGVLFFVGQWAGGTLLSELYERGKASTTEPLNAKGWPEGLQVGGPYSFCTDQFVLPLTHAEVQEQAPPNGKDYAAWAKSVGGVRAHGVWIEMQVTAAIPTTIAVTGMNVGVRSRRSAMEGVWLAPNGCGDYYERVWAVNLDTDPPESVLTDSGGGEYEFPIPLGQGDLLIVAIGASAFRSDVEFVVDLSYVDSSNGETNTLTLDDEGSPFRVSGVAATREQFLWTPDTGELVWGLTAESFPPGSLDD